MHLQLSKALRGRDKLPQVQTNARTPQAPQMPAFLMSLDCEGNWGFSDRRRSIGYPFSNENLLAVTKNIVELLGNLGLRATFAIVGAYVLSPDEFAAICSTWQLNKDDLTKAFSADWAQRKWDGWFNPEILTLISEPHEIAGHGFLHRELRPDLPHESVTNELDALASLEPFAGRDWTMVFPRNTIGHIDKLSARRIVGYRDAGVSNLPHRLHAKLRGPVLESHAMAAPGPIVVPGGHLIHWRCGVRRIIPAELTRLQWKSVLQQATEKGGVVHLSTHPHNFITGPSGFSVLRDVLKEAALLVHAGRLRNPTMLDYCQQARSH